MHMYMSCDGGTLCTLIEGPRRITRHTTPRQGVNISNMGGGLSAMNDYQFQLAQILAKLWDKFTRGLASYSLVCDHETQENDAVSLSEAPMWLELDVLNLEPAACLPDMVDEAPPVRHIRNAGAIAEAGHHVGRLFGIGVAQEIK